MTQQIMTQLNEEVTDLRSEFRRFTSSYENLQDDGYDASGDDNEEIESPAEGEEPQYIQGSLDQVVEEDNSEYFTNEERQEFS
jgi:hypothetical protein